MAYAVECPHCKALGICQHATFNSKLIRAYDDWENFEYWMECDKCGTGLIQHTQFMIPSPTCAVCGGKGYTVIQASSQSAEQSAQSVEPQSQDRVLSVQEFLQMLDKE